MASDRNTVPAQEPDKRLFIQHLQAKLIGLGQFRPCTRPSDDKVGPYGAKSISEIGVKGAAPAIASAIHDACGVWMRSWPMTPEKLLHELGRI